MSDERTDFRRDTTLINELREEADRLHSIAYQMQEVAQALESVEDFARAKDTMAEARRRIKEAAK